MNDLKMEQLQSVKNENFSQNLKNPKTLSKNSGEIAIFSAPNPKKTNEGTEIYCANFPGYTGDASTHEKFIQASLGQGIGVICITPSWSPSISKTQQNTKSLLESETLSTEIKEGIQFVRANSFGSYLSLLLFAQIEHQIKKTALVSPCSAKQLPFAGKQMGIPVTLDIKPIELMLNDPISLRIILLEKDAVVPELDSLFLSLSKKTEFVKVTDADHFTVGNIVESTVDIAKWFGESQ